MRTVLDSPFTSFDQPDRFHFNHVFQPIYSLQGDMIVGFESLIRGTQIQNPQLLFAMAEKQQKLFELDVASVTKSILRFNQLVSSKDTLLYLTVNIYPSTLVEPSFLRHIENVMRSVNLPPRRVIFELNEAEYIEDLQKLQTAVKFLKSMGFVIALDDLGKGHSSLRIALELEPDMVKLDQYFSVDLEHSIRKQSFLDWITSYFLSQHTFVTLEGIETEAQSTIAKQMGVPYGQGYYLGTPQPLENYFQMK